MGPHQLVGARAFPGHLPESRLDCQLSFAQPLLLGESAFRVGLETGRGRGNGGLDRRPFDQQGHRFGQVLVRNPRIGSFDEEGEASAVRRRLEDVGGYGVARAAFKKLVDAALTKVYKSGEINKIYEKWFLKPIPPKNIKVGLALSESTKAAWASPNDKPMEDYAKK